jgi:hypothetical protein
MAKTYPTSSYLTAIHRVTPSAPARSLKKAGLLLGRMLDYGCGYGKDAETYGMDKYDTHFCPHRPEGEYDTVTCTYVLNVVDPKDVPYILGDIQGLLAPGGRAYLTVRRDLKASTVKGRGTFQRNVILNLPVTLKGKGYCTYLMQVFP